MTTITKRRLLAAVVFISGSIAQTADVLVRRSEAQASLSSEPASQSIGSVTKSLVLQLEAAGTSSERLSLAKQLSELGTPAMPTLLEHLRRSRESTDLARREVLVATGAAVPDETGRFATPKRQTTAEEKTRDEFDWLAALSQLEPREGLSDVVVDVSIIRAFAAWKDPDAGKHILDFAFSEVGVIYRDECGRYLRKMSPYSLPALILGSQSRDDASLSRYTKYQLERLDRQDAHWAIRSAPTENLKIAIIEAYAASQYREAVFAILNNVDHVAPRVRRASRLAWTEFATGREPPKPPTRQLTMPNGKLTSEKEPLWLDHRALAMTAIRGRLRQLTGVSPDKKFDLRMLTEQLFEHYDQKREEALKRDFSLARRSAKAGEVEQATRIYDRILAQNPDFGSGGKMVPAYLALAQKREKSGKWKEAAIAYGKASAMASTSKQVKSIQTKQSRAAAKWDASNKPKADPGDDDSLQRPVSSVVAEIVPEPEKESNQYLLWAGLLAIVVAMLFLLLGLSRRRQRL